MADALKDAQELYQESLDALRDQRRQIEEDLEFSDPSNPEQWDKQIKSQRENDPGGKRPCLVHDQLGQYVANVAGQVEKQPPSLHAIPVGGGADKKAAEQIDGRFRHIEHASRATQHYARALTAAARVGVGYLVIRPTVTDAAMNHQEPRISSEPDPLRVVFDPWSTETDGSDATFGFILTPVNPKEFARKWGKKAQRDFGDTEATQRGADDRKSILVAEQWRMVTDTRNVVVYTDENGMEASEAVDEAMWHEQVQASGMPYQFIRSYKDKFQSVKWRQMSGADILEEADYPADYIGIVPVYGYVGFADGRMRYCGIPRRARAPMQAYNYHISEQLAYIATAPKSPWIASKRAIAGVEALWERASVETRGVLPYNDSDDTGPVSPPFRTNVATSLVNHEMGAAQALKDIQAAIGMYQANLGAESNETSGVAIESRKQQGEASTAHFPAHMAASLGHVGKIVMQMDAKLSDTRRKQPIIGVDESPGSVYVDPDQQEAFKRNKADVSINPKVGQYGVRVVVGASYSTQRTQTNAAFTEIMRASKDPALVATVMPFWAQTLDFPGSDKFAQAVAAMAPEPVKAILKPEGDGDEVDPAVLSQQLDQCKQALQEAIQHAKDAQQDGDEAIAELAAVKRDDEVKRYEAETNRLKVTGANEQQIQAIVNDLVGEILGPVQQADPMQTGQPMDAQQMPEPPEPAPPSPEILALAQGQQEIADSQQQIAQAVQQGNQTLAQMVQELAVLMRKTRRRIPVRDKNGDITEVIDKMDDESPSEDAAETQEE